MAQLRTLALIIEMYPEYDLYFLDRDARLLGQTGLVISQVEKDPRAGRCWARVECNFKGDAAAFEAASAKFIDHTMNALPGVHRAWLMKHAPHAGQIGPDPVGQYLMMYELDAPENLFDPSLGQERLPQKDGQAAAGRLRAAARAGLAA